MKNRDYAKVTAKLKAAFAALNDDELTSWQRARLMHTVGREYAAWRKINYDLLLALVWDAKPRLEPHELRYCELEGIRPSDFLQTKRDRCGGAQ